MLCPICKTTLVPGEDRAFETLAHHVECPNEPCPADSTVVCPNGSCEANQDGVFWAAFSGEGPYHSGYKKDYKWIDNNDAPFDSFQRQLNFSIGYHFEDRQLSTRFVSIRRKVTYKSNEHGDKVGKRVKYSVIWPFDGTMYRLTESLSPHMFLFSLNRFYLRKAAASKYDIKDIIHGLDAADWPRAEIWRKAVRLWVETFHGEFLKQIGYKRRLEQ